MFYYANHEQLKRKTSWYSTSFQNVLGAGRSVHEPLLPFSCLIGIREREEGGTGQRIPRCHLADRHRLPGLSRSNCTLAPQLSNGECRLQNLPLQKVLRKCKAESQKDRERGRG